MPTPIPSTAVQSTSLYYREGSCYNEYHAAIGLDLLIDGEAVGDTLHAFDLLELAGADLSQRGYLNRYRGLAALLGDGPPGISVVATTVDPASKRAMFAACRDSGREGVVFKDVDAPFTPGRPASGGPQLKHNFVETASLVVGGINARRSVTLGLHRDGDRRGPVDHGPIPANPAVPRAVRASA